MPAIQPQEELKVPEAKQKALDAINNKITTAEAEVSRLGGLITSNNKTIVEQQKEKTALTEDVAGLKKEKEVATDELKKVKANIIEADETFIKNQEANSELIKEQNKKTEDLNGREEAVTAREVKANEKDAELKKREETVEADEAKIEAKKTKLKNVLEEI